MTTQARFAFALMASAAAALMASCGGENEGVNILPDTEIVSAPPQGSSHSYKVDLSWSGTDPDGSVAGYEIAWHSGTVTASTFANLSWDNVAVTESTFSVLADSCCKDDEPYRSHTFFVRAVDNDGGKDPDPPHVSFNATTLLPRSRFISPSGGFAVTVPSCVTVAWTGEDDDGEVVEYQYARKLYEDVPPGGPPDSGDSRWSPWTTDTQVTISLTQSNPENPWSFYVRAKDDAGAAENAYDPGRNYINVYIDPEKENQPWAEVCCTRGACSGKAGPELGCRSTDHPEQMEVGIPVMSGDTLCFTADVEPGDYAREATHVGFRYNDDREPAYWRPNVPENRIHQLVADSDINVLYFWVKDDYCETGSTATVRIKLLGQIGP